MSNYKGKGKIVNYRESLKTQENALVKSEKADFSKSFHRNNEFLEVTYYSYAFRALYRSLSKATAKNALGLSVV